VPIDERSLFKIRHEADFWKSIWGLKKHILSSPALSKLNERWKELSTTALKIEASLDAGIDKYVTMETAPLDTAKYVEKGEEATIDLVQSKPISYFFTELEVHFGNTLNLSGGLQRFRNGKVVQALKRLKRPSRSSANSHEDTEEFDSLVSEHEAYVVRVQEFADTTTPEQFRQWANEDAIPEDKR
jgi:hypothetical protein